MTGQTIDGSDDFVGIPEIAHIGNRVTLHRMADAIDQRQNGNRGKVIFRQLDLALENRDQVLAGKLGRVRVRTMALEAESVDIGRAQQMFVISAMRCVAGGASLLECRLMQMRFLHLIRLIAVARQASLHGIGLQEARRLSRVRVVAGDAFPLGSGMLHFRFFDFIRLVGVAGQAKRARVGIRQNDFALFGRLMARIAHLVLERIVQEGLHQLWLVRLMGIVALQTVRGAEGLAHVSFLQIGVFDVVTVNAEGRNIFLEVRREFDLAPIAILVGQMAGVAPRVERRVTAAVLGNVHAFGVATEA